MADSTLSRQHALTLLKKLATDDEFRKQFEEKPAKALVDMGVPHETVVNLPAASLAPIKLADKSKFQELHDRIASEPDAEWLCMVIPNLRLERGSDA
jgi:putative modified peptide